VPRWRRRGRERWKISAGCQKAAGGEQKRDFRLRNSQPCLGAPAAGPSRPSCPLRLRFPPCTCRDISPVRRCGIPPSRWHQTHKMKNHHQGSDGAQEQSTGHNHSSPVEAPTLDAAAHPICLPSGKLSNGRPNNLLFSSEMLTKCSNHQRQGVIMRAKPASEA
jgi:hypothetical protein